jgi:hypothetical protein
VKRKGIIRAGSFLKRVEEEMAASLRYGQAIEVERTKIALKPRA